MYGGVGACGREEEGAGGRRGVWEGVRGKRRV